MPQQAPPPQASQTPETPRLPMASPERLEISRQEAVQLEALAQQPFHRRLGYYFSRSGPGWMQSAMTLGGGSAVASLSLGANFGYELLWVQPLAMLMGIIMLMAAAHQTLSTGERPFEAMRRHVNPLLAWAWVIATILSTIVWDFPQFALAAGVTEDIVLATTGWIPQGGARSFYLLGIGFAILLGCTAVVWNYNRGRRGVKIFDTTLKTLIWGILLCFLVVIVRASLAGHVPWAKVFAGFIPSRLPTDAYGVTTIMAAFGAAVGLNMTFLFGYSLLARGWGRSHRGLARFDLITGMFIPYTLATSLMVIASAITLHGEIPYGAHISPIQASATIAASGAGEFFGRVLFGLGIWGMGVSTIIMHMLVSGFALCEIMKWPTDGWRYRLACLLPAPAVTGVLFWPTLQTYIALPTSAVSSILLPIAYIGWFFLNNNRKFLGDDTPRGWIAKIWNIGMLLAITLASASAAFYIWTHL